MSSNKTDFLSYEAIIEKLIAHKGAIDMSTIADWYGSPYSKIEGCLIDSITEAGYAYCILPNHQIFIVDPKLVIKDVP